MTTQRVLILCQDATGIEGMVKVPSLRGVHFSFLPDWQSGSTALRKENFSAIVAQKHSEKQDAEAFVAEILDLAPKTPLMLILPRREGPSVLEALKGGAAEILFEENLSESLVPCLEKYLYSGYGLLRRLSLDELFDFCIPVITTTEMALLSVTILEKLREALGATCGVLFREGGSSPTRSRRRSASRTRRHPFPSCGGSEARWCGGPGPSPSRFPPTNWRGMRRGEGGRSTRAACCSRSGSTSRRAPGSSP
jgi:hypothetical protein